MPRESSRKEQKQWWYIEGRFKEGNYKGEWHIRLNIPLIFLVTIITGLLGGVLFNILLEPRNELSYCHSDRVLWESVNYKYVCLSCGIKW